MISEELCDTEDWSNDLITGINYILQYIQIENCNNISEYYCTFDKINAAFVSRRDFSENIWTQPLNMDDNNAL